MGEFVAFGIAVLIICLVAGVVWWAVGYSGAPEPVSRIARIIIVVVALIAFIYALKGTSLL